MKLKNVNILKGCILSDDLELSAYAREKLEENGIMFEKSYCTKTKRLTDHQLYELYHSDDNFLSKKSNDLVIRYYNNYIYSLIHDYFNSYRLDYLEDLYQCGVVGLLKSLAYYDGSYTITTYSRMYILHEMTGYVYYLKNIPSTHYAKVRRIVMNAEERMEKEGILATDEDIVKETGLSMKIVKRERQLLNKAGMVYLDSYSTESLDSYFNTYEIDSMVEEAVFNKIKFEQMIEILKKLPEYQKSIIYLRIFKGKSFSEIAKELGIDKEKIRTRYYHTLSNVRKKMN